MAQTNLFDQPNMKFGGQKDKETGETWFLSEKERDEEINKIKKKIGKDCHGNVLNGQAPLDHYSKGKNPNVKYGITEATKIYDGKNYFFTALKKEMYFWDMRCWGKPKAEHTIQDIVNWIDNNCQPNNCGHLLYCIKTILANEWLTKKQIAEKLLQNKNVQFSNKIGTWGKGRKNL